MLLLRTVLAFALVLCGLVILVRMFAVAPAGPQWFNIIPGVVLGAAMIALGVHRLSLIARVRRML